MITTNKFKKLEKKATQHIEKNEYQKAKETYIECLAHKPHHIGTLNNLAQTSKILNETAKAQEYNRLLLEELDNQPEIEYTESILIMKINALLSLNKTKQAKQTIEELLKISPDNMIGLFFKIQQLYQNQQYTETIPYINKILNQDPYNIHALLLKGRFHAKLKEYDASEKYYNQILLIDSKNIAAITLKLDLFKQKSENYQAHELMLTAIEYWNNNDLKTSEEYFDKALKINPKYDEIWFCLGELCMELGKIEKSKSSFEKASKLNPKRKEIIKSKKIFKTLKIMKIINKILRIKE